MLPRDLTEKSASRRKELSCASNVVKECKALIRFSISASPTVAYLVTIIFYFKYLSHKTVNMHIKRRASFPSLYIQYLVQYLLHGRFVINIMSPNNPVIYLLI